MTPFSLKPLSPPGRTGHLLFWCAFGAALLLRAWGIASQPPLDDEVEAAYSALNYIAWGDLGQVMWYHPPLRNLVLLATGKLFGGFTAWGLRAGSLVLGALSVPLLGYTAYALLGDLFAAACAAWFLALDPLHILLSREAFQEAMTPCLILLGTLAGLASLRGRVGAAYLAGALFGLASAAKWHGLFPWALFGTLFLFASGGGPGNGKRDRAGRLLHALAAYGALPLAIYGLVWLPWIQKGYGLGEFLAFQKWLVIRQYHHPGQSYANTFLVHRAWTWFVKPVAWVDFVFDGSRPHLGVGVGNMFTWFLTLPAAGWALLRALRRRDRGLALLLALFAVSYLPLVLTRRGVWVFSAPAVIIFAFPLGGWLLSRLAARGRRAAAWVGGYLALAALVAGIFYPMASFRTLDYDYLKPVSLAYSPHARQPSGGEAADERKSPSAGLRRR